MDKDQKDLPLPDPELPKPEKDLPLPEKEITAHSTPSKLKPKLEGKNPFWLIVIGGLIIAIIIASVFAVVKVKNDMDQSKAQAITTYDECVAAGYPILESYPEQCAVPDGPTFTRELTDKEKENLESNTSSGLIWEILNSEADPNFKIFKNTTNGYAFEYPAYLSARCNEIPYEECLLEGKSDGRASENRITIEVIPVDAESRNYGFTSKNIDNFLELEIGESYAPNDKPLELFGYTRIEDTIVDGVPAKVLKEYDKFWELSPDTTRRTVIISKDDYVYVIDGLLESSDISLEQFNKLLSTFKFTDMGEANNIDTSSWKTFTSPAIDGLSYKVKYPNNWEIKTEVGGESNPQPRALSINLKSPECNSGSKDSFYIRHFLKTDPQQDYEAIIKQSTNPGKNNIKYKVTYINTANDYPIIKIDNPISSEPAFTSYKTSISGVYYIGGGGWCSPDFEKTYDAILSTLLFTE